MIHSRIHALAVAVVVAIAGENAGAQTAPAPVAVPTDVPPTDPLAGPNDPCTTLGAIVSRPSQTTSVCTVRPNHVLIETGYQNTSADATSTTAAYPQALVRVGTAVPGLELDLQLPSVERLHDGAKIASGTADTGAGIKYIIGYTSRFSYGANILVTAPTGTNGFSADSTTAAYNLNYAYMLSSVFSVAGTFGLDSLSALGQRYSSFIPSLVLTAALPGTTALFVESSRFTHAAGPGTPSRMQYLGGISRGLSPRLILDLEAGGSPTTATGKYRFVGFGASYYL